MQGYPVGPRDKGGENMKTLMRKVAVLIGATAMSVGLMASVAAPADAASKPARDSSWGW